jgi:phosphoribosylaminoimidazolecarboxamide formyltransferase/IMP cyclohydrolase
VRVRRALVSVSDKDGLEGFARGLADLGVTLISTGGTAAALRDWGLEVTSVESVTGQREILGGRVKTLHPKIHGGILGRLDVSSDVEQMHEDGIEPIDLVVVNLYPFEQRAAVQGATDEDLVESIDIGGPAMIRAAAKNHARVGVVTAPSQYEAVLAELRAGGGELSKATLRGLAGAAFTHTARYDAAIADWLALSGDEFPDSMLVRLEKQRELSYGENPHQRAAYYAERGARTHLLARVEQLHGKQLSFNNLLDLDSARALLREFSVPACVLV